MIVIMLLLLLGEGACRNCDTAQHHLAQRMARAHNMYYGKLPLSY
jgi:hypothetical protein